MYNLDKTVEIFINYDINDKKEIIEEIIETHGNITQKQLRRQIKYICDGIINNKEEKEEEYYEKEKKNNKIQPVKDLNTNLNKNINKEDKNNTDDIIKEIINNPDKYPETTLEKKFYDLTFRFQKNPNSSRIKTVLEYVKKLIEEKNIVIVNIDEIKKEVIDRTAQKPIKNSKGVVGIYGYFDKKKGIFIYIGKDSNILLRLRDKHHRSSGDLRIDRILQNDKEGRYEYRVIEIMENATLLDLDTAERYYIKLFNTYHYENPEGKNFTKGGETSYGWESEAKRVYKRTTHNSNRTYLYKGEKDGIKMNKRLNKGGEGIYYISTNGTRPGGRYCFCLNTPNCRAEKQSISLVKIFDYFYEKYPDKTLKPGYGFEESIGDFDELHNLYLKGELK